MGGSDTENTDRRDFAPHQGAAEEARKYDIRLTTSGISSAQNPQSPWSWSEVKDGEALGDGGDGDGTTEAGQPMKKALDFRSDAKIWCLYLEEAERQAKDRMELWKTGLDSLLIFAGLFAGIVSSFLIDARHDLQKNSEQNLLSDIRDTLQGISIGDVTIPVSQKWINALWLISLYMTLFSAIMGILAKAWLAKFVPATTRREAEDAYERYKLDKQAERWSLEDVITLPPMLVQMASFLFLGGLIVQSITDDHTLGHTVLAFCISGWVIYLMMTLLSLSVSAPFDTPLSDLLLWLRKVVTALLTWHWRSKWQPMTADTNRGLAEILHTKLIKSPKPTHVDEAATEIALPSFKRDWIDYLCKNDTPRYLLARFKKCSLTRTGDMAERHENLCSHLLSFLQFVDLLEEKLAPAIANEASLDALLSEYQHLVAALRTSLEHGYPLHRWNNLPESLRPLSFGLRTQTLSLLAPLPERCRQSSDSTPLELDFHPHEMSDRPWELGLQDIRSTHRLHFMLAACRGVLQGQKNVKTTSTLILGLWLAKAGCNASETGRASEWNIEVTERNKVEALARKFLLQFYNTTISELEGMAMAALTDVSPGIDPNASSPRKGLLGILVSALADRALRSHAIAMLSQVSDLKFDSFNPDSVEIFSKSAVFGDESIRKDGLRVLTNLMSSSDDETKSSVTTALYNNLEAGLGHHEPQQRLRAVAFIKTIWSDPSGLFVTLVKELIPKLVEVTLNANSSNVHQLALRLVEDLWAKEFRTDIKDAIANILSTGLDQHTEPAQRCRILTDLSKLLKDDGSRDATDESPYAFAWRPNIVEFFRDMLPKVFEKVVKAAIYDVDDSVRDTAKTLLKDLSKDDRVSRMLNVDARAWLENAAEQPISSWWVRYNAVLVSEIFIKQISADITTVTKLVEWAGEDMDDDVRRSSLELISNVCMEHDLSEQMLQAVKNAILLVENGIINETYSSIRSLWIVFLGDVVKHVTFPEVVPIMCRLFVGADSDSELWTKSHEDYLMPREREKDVDHIKALEGALPQSLEVSLHDSPSWRDTVKWVKLLVVLSRRSCLKATVDKVLEGIAQNIEKDVHNAVKTDSDTPVPQVEGEAEEDDDKADGAVDYLPHSKLKPRLRRLLSKVGWIGRMYWADILGTIATHFPVGSKNAPTILFQIAVHDSDTDVQFACLKSLSRLLNQSPLAITSELVKDIDKESDHFAKSLSWRLRFGFTQLLSSLGRSKECKLSDEVLKKLSSQAFFDEDYDCRSEAVNTFLSLIQVEDPSSRGRYQQYVATVVESYANRDTPDDHALVRQSWIKLAIQIKSAKFTGLTDLFDTVMNDSDPNVQAEAMGALQRLLDDAKVRASAATNLATKFVSALKEEKTTERAVTVLTAITAPPKPQAQHIEQQHQQWIQIILLLVEFQSSPNLIEVAIKEKINEDTFRSQNALSSLFQNVTLPDPIEVILPRAIEGALKSDTKPNVRLATVNLFSSLIGCVRGHAGKSSVYGGLLGRKSDLPIISRLAEIVIKDDYDTLRNTALRVLKSAYETTDGAVPASRFRDAIKESLSKAIEASLRDQENPMARANAVSAVDILTRDNTNDKFSGIVSPSISQLLRIVLVEGDKKLCDSVEKILFNNFTVTTAETKLSRDVFIAIPSIGAAITNTGQAIVLRLAEALPIADTAATTIAHALTPMLRNTSSSARATAIELLLKLYAKHRHSNPQFIDSAIPEIINLAFDEKDGVGGIRPAAIQLLVALSSGRTSLNNGGEGQPVQSTETASSVLKQITPLAADFMALLQVKRLRPSVVELLSLMSLDANVRQTILLRIASLSSGPENSSLIGHVELLTRLISDGRLGEEAADYMMLFLIPALVSRPKLAQYRLRIVTAVWCRYGRRSLKEGDAPGVPEKHKELLDWFTLALFGRHVLPHEARTWGNRCKAWLPAEPQKTSPLLK